MRKVSSHQPSMFPWLGYWNKLDASDLHVLSGGVKFDYAGYQNRVMLNGSWLTLPVQAGAKNVAISEVRFDAACLPKIYRTIRQSLGARRCPGRDAINCIVDQVEAFHKGNFLVDFNGAALLAVQDYLGISTEIVFNKEQPDPTRTKTGRLLHRLRREFEPPPVNYLAGAGAFSYLAFDEMPEEFSVSIQVAAEGVSGETILSAISACPDKGKVLERIRGSFSWKPARETYRCIGTALR